MGLSDTDDYTELKQPGGTAGFISPEQEETGGAHPADDVYSLGIIMNELWPEYRTLRRRCTGALKRRPADGIALLKAFDRRRQRMRRMRIGIGILGIINMALWGWHHIIALDESARSNELKVAQLSERNESNNNLVTTLRDSLNIVGNRLKSTEEALTSVTEYEAMKQSKLQDGYRIIENLLRQADRNTFSKITPGGIQKYNEELMSLTSTIEAASAIAV